MMRALPFAALLLAGCATVERAPPASVAVAELPAGFALLDRERAAAGTVAELLPLGDPAYAALEARAMAGAPTLEQALARIEAARAGVRGARAEQLPSLDASGTVARERINTRQFGGLPPGIAIDRNRTAFNLALSAGWDADVFGRLRAGRRAAVARVDAADADAQAVRVSLRADIARAVIGLRAVDAREAVARRDAASAAELVSITRVRSQAGIAPGFDLVRAEALEADVRGRLAGIGAERAAAIGRLVTLTGAPAQVVVDALRGPGG
jgi:outer membrane protein TolC